jgi:excisionase family DNA binding protein
MKKNYIKMIFEDHINSRPEYLMKLFKELYMETSILYKERMNSKEASHYLGLSVKTLDNLCCNRQIGYYKVGKHREFSLQDLKDYRSKKEKYFSKL